MQNQLLWYIRRDNDIKGPFPSGLVSRYILLGRVLLTDEASVDQEIWWLVKDLPELIPQVIRGTFSDSAAQERLSAAKRWADERLARDRRADQLPDQEIQSRRAGERRQSEPAEVVQHRVAKTNRTPMLNAPPLRSPNKAIMAVLGGAALLLAAFVFMPRQESQNDIRDCLSPAQPKVEWGACKMEGAQLDGANLAGAKLRETNLSGATLQEANMKQADASYALLSLARLRSADLSGATMLGTSLRGADLVNANLQGADLSYADFSGADLTGANLDGAKLDHAIWVDKSTCAPGSVGRCLPALTQAR